MFDPTKLRWAPPAQTTPTVHNVSVWNSVVNFDDDEDVILVMPATVKQNQSQFIGGRHVRVIGGRHTATVSGGSMSLAFQNQTGSVFVEGISFDNTAQPMRDPLWFAGSSDPLRLPDIYIQNCTMVGITGTGEGIHGDAVQLGDHPAGNVHLDCVTADSDYTGLQWNPGEYARGYYKISRYTFANGPDENANWAFIPVSQAAGAAGRHNTLDVDVRDMWVQSKPEYFVPAIWPHSTPGRVLGPLSDTHALAWAKGYAHEAPRANWPADPYVIGTPGLGYVSPGYNDPADQPVFVPVAVDGGGMKPRLLYHFLSARPDGVYRFPAAGGAVSMTWSGGTCSYSGTITVPVEKLAGGQGPMSLTFVDGLLQL